MFTDENGKVIKTFKMSISNAQFDFDGTRGDYIFTDVRRRQVVLLLHNIRRSGSECGVYCSRFKAALNIEPDWVEHKAASEGR